MRIALANLDFFETAPARVMQRYVNNTPKARTRIQIINNSTKKVNKYNNPSSAIISLINFVNFSYHPSTKISLKENRFADYLSLRKNCFI